jgi:hypothetical protein
MFKKFHHRKSFLVLSGIIVGAFLFIECTDNMGRTRGRKDARPPFTEFAGSQACAGCHKAIYESHLHTAHFHTTEPATAKSVKGSFDAGENRFNYNPDEYIAMKKKGNRLYQVAYYQDEEKRREPFDITSGSGKRGQTYMYWKDGRLFQLPISYFTSMNVWCNSPGFSNRIAFNRPITSRCLECHSTFFEKTSDEQAEEETYSPTNIIYGVTCENAMAPAPATSPTTPNTPMKKQVSSSSTRKSSPATKTSTSANYAMAAGCRRPAPLLASRPAIPWSNSLNPIMRPPLRMRSMCMATSTDCSLPANAFAAVR